jgi:hypothetical protein
VDIDEALNKLRGEAGVDAGLVVLINYAELLLGGAEGFSYADNERDSLRTAILQLLAVRWIQGRREEDERLGEATDRGGSRTTMSSEPPCRQVRPRSAVGLFTRCPSPDPSPTPPEAL